MAVFLGVLWTLWGAMWLRRVELRREHEGTVRALGLAWAREGWGPTVVARGAVEGRPVEVRWRRGLFVETLRVRREGGWTDVSADALDRFLREGEGHPAPAEDPPDEP